MKNLITAGFLFSLAACATRHDQVSLDALQGGWWSDCNAPAVEFFINGNVYSGDFLGTHKLDIDGSTLTFKEGLTEGHSVEVTHRPLSFQIMSITDNKLVLRPSPDNSAAGDWTLHSCKGMSPESAF